MVTVMSTLSNISCSFQTQNGTWECSVWALGWFSKIFKIFGNRFRLVPILELIWLADLKIGISDFNDRIAGDEVSALKIEFVIVRNTPKLNLTLYVPIFILMVLFLGSILVPSKSGHNLLRNDPFWKLWVWASLLSTDFCGDYLGLKENIFGFVIIFDLIEDLSVLTA